VELPNDIKSPVHGGSVLWEQAQIAWHLRESLPEFQGREPEQQQWLTATWRAMAKIRAIEAKESWEKRK